MSEFIGSRISLISKSDIKYVGTLHEINSDTHTVSLENVTSYGTEGRKGNPSEEIPGSDQIYEYIVFRGSDVKELNIISSKENDKPAVPNDPAILGSARPSGPGQQPGQQPPQQQQHQQQFPGPQQQQYPPPPQFGQHGPPPHFQNQPQFRGPGGPHGFPGSPGAVPGFGGYGPPPGYYGPPPGQGGFPPQGPYGGPYGPGGPQRGPPQQGPGGPQGPAGNRSQQGTPQQQPAQQPTKPAELSSSATPQAQTQGPPPPNDPKPSTQAAQAPSTQQQPPPSGSKTQAQRAQQRVAVPLASPNTLAAKPAQKPQAQAAGAGAGAAQPKSVNDATEAAAAAVAAAMAKLGQPGQQQQQQQSQQQGGDNIDNLTNRIGQIRVHDSASRGRGRGRGGASGPRGGYHQQTIEVPKEDFDFESSNAKFNKQDLVKEAIATGSPITSPTNGEQADPFSSSTAGSGTAADTDDVVIPPAASASATGAKTEAGYDKKSSFFDNISSDLRDRNAAALAQTEGSAPAFDGRTMRYQERNKNMETFGQGSVDGGFRGRGGHRGRGRGGQRGGFTSSRGRGHGWGAGQGVEGGV